MHPLLNDTDHRPYPLHQQAWVMGQSWRNLLFAHWRVDPAQIRPLLPRGLEVDTFNGEAWLAVVPFLMANVRARGLPPMWGTAEFCELNVRTYVTDGKRQGVWFFSLDASNPLAVWGARRFFHLSYYNATMRQHWRDAGWHYTSTRTHRGAEQGEFQAWYRPTSETIIRAEQGTLLHWLTERYCMYAVDARGSLYRGEIHHPQWELQEAGADIPINSMAAAAGIELANPCKPDLLHFAKNIDVLAWMVARV